MSTTGHLRWMVMFPYVVLNNNLGNEIQINLLEFLLRELLNTITVSEYSTRNSSFFSSISWKTFVWMHNSHGFSLTKETWKVRQIDTTIIKKNDLLIELWPGMVLFWAWVNCINNLQYTDNMLLLYIRHI